MKQRLPSNVALANAAPVTEPRVEVITDYNSFLGLEPIWDSLLDRAGIDHPFLEYQWVRTWWECFGGGKKLYTLVVWDGSEPIAIAPLLINRQRMYGLKLRQLEFFQNDHTARFDFIVGRSPVEAYRAIWKHLAGLKEVWDVMKLCQVPGGSATLEQLPSLADSDGLLTGLWRSSNAPYLPIAGGSAEYLAGLRGEHRYNLRRCERRLRQLGSLDVEILSAPDGARASLEQGIRIDVAAWKGKAGAASAPDVRRFYTKLGERAIERGWLQLHFLKLNGKSIAFGYCLNYKNKLYLLKSGSDPQYASCSPYNLLFCKVVQNAFESGVAEIDLLSQDERPKLEWPGNTRPHYWVFIFHNSLRNSLLHHAKFRLAPWLQGGGLYPSLRDAVLGRGQIAATTGDSNGAPAAEETANDAAPVEAKV